MSRIFLTLAALCTLALAAALVLGLEIGDPRSVSLATRKLLNYHLLVAVGALIFAVLVHAVLLTYFMGTGRWLEETTAAYRLDARWHAESRRLKYRTLSPMAVCLVLLIANIPLGALSVDSGGWGIPLLGTISPARVHLVFAVLTFVANVAVNAVEYRSIVRNGRLIAEVVDEVRRMRLARGLPV